MLTQGYTYIVYRQGFACCTKCGARRWVGVSLPAAITFCDEHQSCSDQPQDGGGAA